MSNTSTTIRSSLSQLVQDLGRQPTLDDFLIESTLGEGSFSTVYKATFTSNHIPVALKACDKRQLAREGKAEYAEREKRALKLLEAKRCATAPFFVRLLASFEDAHTIYFVLSFGAHGDLQSHLERFGALPLERTRFYGAELVRALEHLRSIAIVHRDLKPANILLDEEWHVKVSDFGTAKIVDGDSMKPPDPALETWVEEGDADSSSSEEEPAPRGQPRRWSFVGSAPYVSPEVLRGQPVSHCVDLWALGVCLYQMETTKPPFFDESDYWTFKKILSVDYIFPDEFNSELKEVVSKLLILRPGHRLGASDEGPEYVSLRSCKFFQTLNLDEVHKLQPSPLQPQDAYCPNCSTEVCEDESNEK